MLRALSSPTRMRMLKRLLKGETHISGLAREMHVSVPVTARHVRILQKAGLVEKKEFGRSHVLKAKPERLYEISDAFADLSEVELQPSGTILDALKLTCAVDTRRIGGREYLISIDGKQGYYLYEVDGKIGDMAMNQYKLDKNAELRLKKLVPVTEKRITVRMRQNRPL
jgi:DNA-binding transcriptional ArsR family regulator